MKMKKLLAKYTVYIIYWTDLICWLTFDLIFSWLVWYFLMVWWINNGVLKKSCGRWNTATWQRVIQQHNSPHWQLFKYHSNQVFECFLMWGGYHKIKPVLAVSMTVNQLWGPNWGPGKITKLNYSEAICHRNHFKS